MAGVNKFVFMIIIGKYDINARYQILILLLIISVYHFTFISGDLSAWLFHTSFSKVDRIVNLSQ